MTKFNRRVDTIYTNITNGIDHGILHLRADDIRENGNVKINNLELLNFGSYSYLGLEHNSKLKRAGIEAIEKFGTQFGYSRAYVSCHLYQELESSLAEIFNADVIVAPSTTLAHQAVLPVIIEHDDIILLDQYVHASVQASIKMIRDKGVKIELIRHSNMERLEERICEMKTTCNNIWYMSDGVYSMYGDYAPLKELEELMNKYDQFHVYMDDAHGMSWTGNKGVGYVMSQIKLHDQMILVTSLNKAFAAAGGAIVLPRESWYRKIKSCGGTLIFSTPIQPPMLGIGVASAKFHLSDELRVLQKDLEEKVLYCSQQIEKARIPEISQNLSPIFYIPTSLPKVSYNLVKRLQNEGILVTPALFPAVSMRKSGIRICINTRLSKNQITEMISAMSYHYPLALSEEGLTEMKVLKAFGVNDVSSEQAESRTKASSLSLEITRSVGGLNAEEWNELLGGNGSFDTQGLEFLEKAFSGNKDEKDNWDFFYFIVRDDKKKPVLATFFTRCFCKNDIFKPARLSEKLEHERYSNPMFQVTKSLMMGSLLSEGEHLFIDREHKQWEVALSILLDEVQELQQRIGTNAIYFRDFEKSDVAIRDLLVLNGFVEVQIPDYSHEITGLGWTSTDEFLMRINSKRRQQLRRDSIKFATKYRVRVKKQLTLNELKHAYQLYLNVKTSSFTINTFDLPFSVFETMNSFDNWEVILLSLKGDEPMREEASQPIAVVFAYCANNVYSPMLVGLDYSYLHSHKNYKQAVWQVVQRANELNVDKLYFGFTAGIEKQRVGAVPIKKVAYVQIEDGYAIEQLELKPI